MTRSTMTFLLAILLAGEGLAQTPQAGPQASTPGPTSTNSKVSQLKLRIQRLPKGSVITVKLHKGQKLKGRLASVSTSGFSLQTLEEDKITEKAIPFDQVVKLSDEWTSSQKKQAGWLIAGTAMGSGILAVIILAAIGSL